LICYHFSSSATSHSNLFALLFGHFFPASVKVNNREKRILLLFSLCVGLHFFRAFSVFLFIFILRILKVTQLYALIADRGWANSGAQVEFSFRIFLAFFRLHMMPASQPVSPKKLPLSHFILLFLAAAAPFCRALMLNCPFHVSA